MAEGIELLRQTIERIKGGQHPGIVAISECTLEQALEMEQKVLAWAQKHNYDLVGDVNQKIENPEHVSRIHIYKNYLKPQIEELQLARNVEKELLQPENTQEQPKLM